MQGRQYPPESSTPRQTIMVRIAYHRAEDNAAGVTHSALADVTTVDTDCDGQERVAQKNPRARILRTYFLFGNGTSRYPTPTWYAAGNGG